MNTEVVMNTLCSKRNLYMTYTYDIDKQTYKILNKRNVYKYDM